MENNNSPLVQAQEQLIPVSKPIPQSTPLTTKTSVMTFDYKKGVSTEISKSKTVKIMSGPADGAEQAPPKPVRATPLPSKPVVWAALGTKPMGHKAELPKLVPRMSKFNTKAGKLLVPRIVQAPKNAIQQAVSTPILDKEVSKSLVRSGRLGLLRQEADRVQPTSQAVQCDSNDPAELLQATASCITTGHLDEAKNYLIRAWTTDDKELCWELWTDLGLCFYEQSAFHDAVEAYESANMLFSDRLISQFNLGTAKLMAQEFSEALICFQKANDIEQYQPKVLCNIGAAYFLQENFVAAEENLREAINSRPDYVRAMNTLSAAIGAQGRFDEALELCEGVLVLNPGHPEAWLKKGVIYLYHDRVDEAVECFKYAMVDPNFKFDACCYLGMTFAAKNQCQEAEQALHSIGDVQNFNSNLLARAWAEIGRSWQRAERIDEAIVAFKKVCKLIPLDGDARFELDGVMRAQQSRSLF